MEGEGGKQITAWESARKITFCCPGHPCAVSRAQAGCHTPLVAAACSVWTQLESWGWVCVPVKHTAS